MLKYTSYVSILSTVASVTTDAPIHTLPYRLFYSRCDHGFLNEHHAVLQKT